MFSTNQHKPINTDSDGNIDFSPRTFDEYLGQTTLKKKLSVYTQAALMRNEPLDHVLFFGPPGLGKTTLSQIMAHTMNTSIKICSGPTLERTGDMVAILSSLEPKEILFIDEIHRLPSAVEELLYTAMEQFKVDVIIGQGAGAKSVSLPLHPFTLIGATTKSGMLSAPLRSRFGIIEHFDFYSVEELMLIIAQNCQFLSINIEEDALKMIANCGRGTPRIAKKLIRRVRDIAQVKNQNTINAELAQEALTFLGLDHEGFSLIDRRIIQTLMKHPSGGPMGLETIASIIGEDAETIETVYEPYLIRMGFIEKTSRGRRIPDIKKIELTHHVNQKKIW